MDTTDAFAGMRCVACGNTHDSSVTHRCPDCGGPLDPVYDYDVTDPTPADLTATPGDGLATFAPVLPFPAGTLVTSGEGATPLVETPALATALGVGAVYVKDEGASTTGSFFDRGLGVAVTAAREHGASEVGLPSMGNDAQAAAAYAARAGLGSHSFVPSRTQFVNKAMINIHGGEMSVVGGRYADAREAFEAALAGERRGVRSDGLHSLAPFDTPYRHEGAKTLAYEIVADLDWSVPDAIVHPTGHGTGLVGLGKGMNELATLGLVGERPRLYAAQASGCAPLASAWAADEPDPSPPTHPDTIVGPLEIPDPAGGGWVLDTLAATDGGAVASDDDAILEGGVRLAETGITVGPSGGAALAGAQTLAEAGEFGADDVVVLVNPTTGTKESDILRSHLMSKGI